MIDSNLLQFQKPGRYLGKEWNLHFKKIHSRDIRVCVCFPQTYEIGMSNLGFRIVYELFHIRGVSVERCFMPDRDLQNYLTKTRNLLCSLETKTALKNFDVVAFSINYELNLINFIQMLKMGGIELRSTKRNKPLIIVGGIINPEPIADFADLFYLGEFEEQAHKFIANLKKTKQLSKEERLISLTQIKGVYVPKFYTQQNRKLLPLSKHAVFPLKRVYTKNLNKHFYPRNWIVPYISLIFDRLQIELQRGCPNRCKFCQARSVYYPYRERASSLVIKRIKTLYKATGYETISLLGLSVIDYSGLENVLGCLIPYLKKERVGIAIPSLRPTGKASKIVKMLAFAKKPGLTLALEAANKNLRKSIGKDIDIDDCREIVKTSAHLGYRHLKFYFMIGLPNESCQDVINIGDTIEFLAKTYKKERGHFPKINLSISYFTPKPFSQFQNLQMQDYDILMKKRGLLKNRIARNKYVKITFSNYQQTLLEYILSRAQRGIGSLLEELSIQDFAKPTTSLNTTEWFAKSRKFNIDLDLFLKSNNTLPTHIGCND